MIMAGMGTGLAPWRAVTQAPWQIGEDIDVSWGSSYIYSIYTVYIQYMYASCLAGTGCALSLG